MHSSHNREEVEVVKEGEKLKIMRIRQGSIQWAKMRYSTTPPNVEVADAWVSQQDSRQTQLFAASKIKSTASRAITGSMRIACRSRLPTAIGADELL